ncbi:uncharacterized protein LOC123686207 [Harmonia axyridis]|uniref:uncharacterized protein LOC123686207 n=1 Tax=Harmonia axyridis TaxID=115357 RepID=UPI001E276171|nr:uncharacterized protein LOC123686207 [Harmonia axyridis]
MRTHFIAQELQQTTERTYREILTTIWNEIKPERQSYPNLLSNRVRRMLESGKFSRVELNNIERSTRPFAPVPEDDDQNTECSPSETLTHQETDVNNETSQKRSKIQQIFESNFQMYTRISPQERPQIPRLKGSRKILESVQNVNDIIGTILSSQSNLDETTDCVYAGAITVCEVNKIRLRSTESTPRRETTPPWKIRLETKIKNIRKKIGKLHTYLQTDSPTRKLLKSIHRISSEIHIQERGVNFRQKLQMACDTLKQKVKALGNRLKRYNDRVKRYKNNQLYQKNPKQFFRSLEGTTTAQEEPPTAENMHRTWKQMKGSMMIRPSGSGRRN